MGRFTQYGPAHKILVLIAYAQKPPLNIHNLVSSRVRGQIFGLSLQLLPYFVYAEREGSS